MEFQIGTGAEMSVISEEDFDRLSSCQLKGPLEDQATVSCRSSIDFPQAQRSTKRK